MKKDTLVIEKAKLPNLTIVYETTQETINSIYPHYYAKGAVEFFLEHHNIENIAQDIKSGNVFLGFDPEKNVIGTVTIRRNEICRLFVLPQYQKQGYVMCKQR